MLISGTHTYLELMEPAEAATVRDWMNEIELRRLAWAECPLPVGLDDAERWIREMNSEGRGHASSPSVCMTAEI